jgi:hypothetical protein
MYKALIIICLIFCSFAFVAQASDQLLFLEVQGIGGYSSQIRRPVYYSMDSNAEMQKPGIGFDYIKKFSGESGDIATFALQTRLALTDNGDSYKGELQVYNAYVKMKTPLSYIWLGHNRPAFGLSSYLDSHSLLLRTLSIQGFGYDRDWGAGMTKDFTWGDIAVSATTGSGMPVYTQGNYMYAARTSYGVLSRDNYNAGFSLGYGRTLDTMGYTLNDAKPGDMRLGGFDLAILRNRFEHRFDLLAGTWLDKDTYALLYRFGINIGQEGRLKIEAQPTYWKFGDVKNYQVSFSLSRLVTSDLTIRAAYTYDKNNNDNRIMLQFYFYKQIL